MARINKIKRYYLEIENKTPFRVGTGDDEDQILKIKNKEKSMYIIPATTISGIFRDFLNTLEDKNKIKKYLYGVEDTKNSDKRMEMSSIIFYDAICYESSSEIERNHIRIDNSLGVAEDKSLRSEQFLNISSKFKLVIELRDKVAENEIKFNDIDECIEKYIEGIKTTKVRFGSNTGFGFGKFKVIYIGEKEYDLSYKESLKKYIDDDIYDKNSYEKKEVGNDKAISTITLKAFIEEGMFINSAKIRKEKIETISEPYIEKIDKERAVIIPSSTLKGAIRERIKFIDEIVGNQKLNIESMFGNSGNNRKNSDAVKGYLIFNDVVVKEKNIKKEIFSNIKIDRFTGGAYTGSLRNKEVIFINNTPSEAESEKLLEIKGSNASIGLGKLCGVELELKIHKSNIVKDNNNNLNFDEKGEFYKIYRFN